MFTMNKGLLADLVTFALQMPDDCRCYRNRTNKLRDFLLDLKDCANAIGRAQDERRDALNEGRPAPEHQ